MFFVVEKWGKDTIIFFKEMFEMVKAANFFFIGKMVTVKSVDVHHF